MDIIYFLKGHDLEEDGQEPKERSSFFDRIHTEILFFIRGSNLEKDFENTFAKISFLQKMVEFLESKWVHLRTYLSFLPRFGIWNNSGAKLVFSLLEVNAQTSALLTKIRFDVERKRMYYEEAFERLHFTISKNGTAEEKEYYSFLHQLVSKSYQAYGEKTKLLADAVEVLANNIDVLRSDFDSNTNVILQWLMFLLSIVLIFWGAFTVFYDKIVLPVESAINQPLELIAGILLIGLVTAFALYLLMAVLGISLVSRPRDKRINKMVNNWLNDKVPDKVKLKELIIDRYSPDKKTYSYRARMNLSIRFCTFLLAGVALDKIKPEEGEQLLKSFEEKQLKKQGSVKT